MFKPKSPHSSPLLLWCIYLPVFCFLSIASQASTLNYDPFDEYLEKGIHALEIGDASGAIDWFDKARKDAPSRDQKKLARELKRQGKIYKSYFEYIREGEQYFNNNRWKSSQDKYEKAQGKLRDVDMGLLAELREFNQDCLDKISETLSTVNTHRTEAFQSALADADAALDTDPRHALNKYKYAESQMKGREKSSHSMNGKIQVAKDRVDYMDHMDKGNKASSRRDYLAALASYQKAQSKWRTAEIADLIASTKINIYDKFKMEGDQASGGGNLEVALEKYKKALEYQDTPDIHQLIEATVQNLHDKHIQEGDNLLANNSFNQAQSAYDKAKSYLASPEVEERKLQAKNRHYEYLVQQGQTAYQNKNYSASLNFYHDAQRINNTSDIQNRIATANRGVSYQNYLNQGNNYAQSGNIAAAQTAYKNAQAQMNTSVVQGKIQNIRTYQNNMSSGKNAYNARNKNQALSYFRNARNKFNTAEARNWISRSENMPTDITVVIDQRIVSSYNMQNARVNIYSKANNQKTKVKTLPYTRGRYTYAFNGLTKGNYQAEIYGHSTKNQKPRNNSDGIGSISSALSQPITQDFRANGGKLRVTLRPR